jgi:hypothetical protein
MGLLLAAFSPVTPFLDLGAPYDKFVNVTLQFVVRFLQRTIYASDVMGIDRERDPSHEDENNDDTLVHMNTHMQKLKKTNTHKKVFTPSSIY